ncbi:MAG: type II toxin-antitoxin system Phd/YefM family antitoxin [Chloroflexi bacterium]|nr:type II toxin-antitoxin system Phd/YefM family antitoxin [Chloroflexota bacterium]
MRINAPKGFWTAEVRNGFAEILERAHSGGAIFIIQDYGIPCVVADGIDGLPRLLEPTGECPLTSR